MAPKKPMVSIKPSKQGSYTARAKARGHTVVQQTRIDLAPGSKASPAIKKKAQFAKNARGWSH